MGSPCSILLTRSSFYVLYSESSFIDEMLKLATVLFVVNAVNGCNWSEIYLSCSKDEKVFEGLSPSSDYTNGLSHCKIDAREEDCNYIYFQSLEYRPAGKYCHGYNSCEDFRFASLGGQNYYWDDYSRSWS